MYEAQLKKKETETKQNQKYQRSSPATTYYRAFTEIPVPVGTSTWTTNQ